jgi:DNA-binding transcriptional LysR family regulator
MELYQLRTFLAVVAEGNLTRAADRVHTSAPAVSAQIRSLEDELGVLLFERTSRGMALTAAGERVATDARRTLDAAQGLRATAEQLRGSVAGIVRMGTMSDPVGLRLGDVFVKLAERHPRVALHLQQTLSVQAMEDVRRGQLDCAYVLSSAEPSEDLELRRLAPVNVVPVLPARWATAGLPGTNAELARRAWVGTAPACGLRGPLEQFFQEAGVDLQPGATADSEAAIRGMVASGLGAGVLREDQAREAERAGEVMVWNQWSSLTWLCWVGPAGPGGAAAQAVRDTVAEVWR